MISKLNKIEISKNKVWLLIHFYLFSFLIATVILYSSNYFQSKGILLKDFIFLGGDYISFYVASLIVDNNIAQLYDFSLQKSLRIQIFPELNSILQNELYFIYPPLVALFFSALKSYDYYSSYLLYSAFSVLVMCLSLFYLCKSSDFFKDNSVFSYILLIFGYPAYTINCLIGGQLSWVATSIYAICYVLITHRKFFYAGLVFSFSYYKPPLFLISAFIFCVYLEKTFLLGFLLGGTFLVCLTYFIFDKELFLDYLIKASSYTYDQDFAAGLRLPSDQGAGLVGLVFSLPISTQIKVSFLLILLIIMLLMMYLVSVHVHKKWLCTDKFWYSATVCISCLFSIQYIRYDLSILLVPFFLLIPECSRAFSRKQSVFYDFLILAIISLFYFEAFFRFIEWHNVRFNLSSIVLFAFTVVLISKINYATKGR